MKLTSSEKIGQLFLIGVTQKKNLEDVIKLIKKYKIGGVVIYKNNYDTYDEMIEVVNKLKEANSKNKVPLFISIDQEGGRVNRFPKEIKNFKSAYKIGMLENKLISKYANITSEILSKTGINMNFAPVLDLKLHEDNHYIGDRAYSNDPKQISKITELIDLEFKKNNVIPVIKHFPGHGSIKKDSHLFLPVIKDYNKILKSDIIPFIDAIKNGADAIMVGHILIKGETNNLPASISKKYINHIRKEYNYQNLIVSDELAMRSVRYLYGKKRSIKYAINAGVDVIMYKYFSGMENIIDDILIKNENCKLKTNELDNSINRILFTKKKFKINDKKIKNNLDIETYNKDIDKINKLTEKKD